MSRLYEKKYFFYQGNNYGYGTVVKLNPRVYQNIPRIKDCDGVMEFCEGLTNGSCKFRIMTNDIYKKGCIYLNAPLDNSIEFIIKPVEAILQPVWENALENYRKSDKYQRPDTTLCTLWYVAIVLVTTIFKDRIGLWIIETILYINYLINKYRD